MKRGQKIYGTEFATAVRNASETGQMRTIYTVYGRSGFTTWPVISFPHFTEAREFAAAAKKQAVLLGRLYQKALHARDGRAWKGPYAWLAEQNVVLIDRGFDLNSFDPDNDTYFTMHGPLWDD